MDGKLRNMTSVYLTCGRRMLLLYRQGSRVVNNLWIGSAGGHFGENELNDAKKCVLRELKEELSVSEEQLDNLRLRYVTLRRTKGELRQNYYFFAELKEGISLNLTSKEGKLKWFEFDELKELEMPFSAKYVIEHYIQAGKDTDTVYGGIADGEKVVFTEMPEF